MERATRRITLLCEPLESRQMLATLVAGDANQDLHFDAADFVQAGKFRFYDRGPTEGVSWESGDWNASESGEPGNPPVGDGEYNADDLVAALLAGAFNTGPYSEDAGDPIHELEPVTDALSEATLIYDAVTGDLTFTTDGFQFSTFHVRSPLGLLSGPTPEDVISPFDIHTPQDFFLLKTGGAPTSHTWPELVQPGLTLEELLSDLRVDGSRYAAGGREHGDIGDVQLLCACEDGAVATLTGMVYSDENQNGQRDAGEVALNDVNVTLQHEFFTLRTSTRDIDLNGDGEIDPLTESGQYQFTPRLAGDVRITLDDADWSATSPVDGYELTVVEGEDETGLDLGAEFLPAPHLAGDANRDFVINALDIDILCNATRQGPYDAKMDLRLDQRLNYDDVLTLVEEVLGTSLGDANLDGRFDSADLVQVWQAGLYEDGENENASWSTGDWNCDQEFDAFDLVAAFQTGAYIVDPSAKALAAKPVAVQPRAATRTTTDRWFETPRTSLQDSRGLRSIAAALPVENSPANRPDSQSFGRQRLQQYELLRQARLEKVATTEVGAQRADEAFRESEFTDTELFDGLWGDPAIGMSKRKIDAMRSEAPGRETFQSIETLQALTLSDRLLQRLGWRRSSRFAKGGNA